MIFWVNIFLDKYLQVFVIYVFKIYSSLKNKADLNKVYFCLFAFFQKALRIFFLCLFFSRFFSKFLLGFNFFIVIAF